MLPEALPRSASKQLTSQDWSYFDSEGEQLRDLPARDCDFTLTYMKL